VPELYLLTAPSRLLPIRPSSLTCTVDRVRATSIIEPSQLAGEKLASSSWYKTSHENWLLKGDLNTEYFYRVANGRKRKQTNYSLKNGDAYVSGNADIDYISHRVL
jgi:hypothetical protein